MEVDGQVVEFEVEDGEGLELPAVNVPAVDDTYVVAAFAARPAELGDPGARRPHAAQLFGERCGRAHPPIEQLAMGGAPAGGFRAPRARPRMAADEPPESAGDQARRRQPPGAAGAVRSLLGALTSAVCRRAR
jgi:hypothetical protein